MPVNTYVCYPRTEGSKFNMEYYLNGHMVSLDKRWQSYGLHSWTVVEFPEGDKSGYGVLDTLVSDSEESFQKAWDAQIPEVHGDMEKYFNIVLTWWVGTVTKQG